MLDHFLAAFRRTARLDALVDFCFLAYREGARQYGWVLPFQARVLLFLHREP